MKGRTEGQREAQTEGQTEGRAEAETQGQTEGQREGFMFVLQTQDVTQINLAWYFLFVPVLLTETLRSNI